MRPFGQGVKSRDLLEDVKKLLQEKLKPINLGMRNGEIRV